MKRSVALIFFVMLAFAGVAQVQFKLSAPNVVEQDSPFRIEFNLNASPDDFTPPTFVGVNVIAGPTVSQGQSVNIVGTKVSRTVSYTYTYVLQAGNTGKITIPSARAVVDGDTYSTRVTTIEVVSGGGSSQSSQSSAGSSQQSQPTGKIAADDIQLRVEVSSQNVYKGQPVKVKFKLYTRVPISAIDNAKYPAFNGFWTQEIGADKYEWQRENLGGKIYDSRVVREYIVFPQQSGMLQVEQMTFSVVAQIVSQGRRQSVFDDFFGGGQNVDEVKRTVSSRAQNITVKPLPSGAPASFDGAVGQFTMDGKVAPMQLSANSAANYDIKISGTGNLPLLTTPKVEFPSSFEQYTVKTTDEFGVSGNNISGSKSFSVPFIPRAQGDYTIPAVEFSYFNTATGKYATLSTRSVPLLIGNDPTGGASSGIVSGVSKEDLKILGSDIRFIKVGDSQLNDNRFRLISSWVYYLLLLIVMGVFAGVLVYMQKRIKFHSNAVLVKNKRAHKMAVRRLKTAQKYINSDKRAFYEEMLKALWGYMGDKLNIPAAQLSKDNIRDKMTEKGIATDRIDGYISVIEQCDFAQYAPSGESKPTDIYKASVDIISDIETSK